MAFGRSTEQREARSIEKQQKKSERATEIAAKKFAASPRGRARSAHEAGARFFEIELTHSSLTGIANLAWTATGVERHERKHTGAPDTLGQIEEEGWHLEHASWVYVERGQNSRDKLLASGQQTVVQGEIRGIFLFRRIEA